MVVRVLIVQLDLVDNANLLASHWMIMSIDSQKHERYSIVLADKDAHLSCSAMHWRMNGALGNSV